MSSDTAEANGDASPCAVRVSAPGKVILHGEHSVVYGKRAVALSLNLRTHLSLTLGGADVSLDLPDVGVRQSWKLETVRDLWDQLKCKQETDSSTLTEARASRLRQFLDITEEVATSPQLALLSFLHLYLSIMPEPVAMSISVNSQLPTGAGLGSSAAYAVCMSAALLHAAESYNAYNCIIDKCPTNLKKVSQWAFRSEQIVHGTPSGIDNSICTYGGAVNFKSGECLPMQVPALRVLLVNTCVPRSTKALVTGVRERLQRLPKVVEPILESLDAISDKGIHVLHQLASATESSEQNSAYSTLDELVDMNHALLRALGVSHPSLERLVGIAQSHGLHAKLTGAGGGGFGIVVLGPTTPEATVTRCHQELEEAGYQVWTTSLGAQGLAYHDA